VPGSSRIGILWNPGDLYTPLLVKNTERAARAMGVQLESLAVQRSGPFEQVFETALFGRVDALITVEDYLTFTYRARILDFAAMSRLPAIYGLREFVDDGGLMSYGTDRRDLYRRSATYVHRILTGARPADLPVESPLKFELAINLKTARALRLAVPPALLQRADHIVH
jgi:putative ABC transport system substrate-binding protein